MGWDYSVIDLTADEKETIQTLKKQGSEGWELVCIQEFRQPKGFRNSLRAFFKKPVGK